MLVGSDKMCLSFQVSRKHEVSTGLENLWNEQNWRIDESNCNLETQTRLRAQWSQISFALEMMGQPARPRPQGHKAKSWRAKLKTCLKTVEQGDMFWTNARIFPSKSTNEHFSF